MSSFIILLKVMIFDLLRLGIDITDEDFNAIYPKHVRRLSSKHWTPVTVAITASEFLVDRPGFRVLDIGSGAGKFCMVGAANTKGYFVGIEQRPHLVELSNKLCAAYALHNVKCIQANITSADFGDYNGFYFYNSFYENIDIHNRIDDSVTLNGNLYDTYCLYLVDQLSHLPAGARLAAYCTPSVLVPRSFRLVDSLHGGSLNLWEKIS